MLRRHGTLVGGQDTALVSLRSAKAQMWEPLFPWQEEEQTREMLGT